MNGLIIYGIYYYNIVCLKKDINEGYKYFYRTEISDKIYNGSKKFEVKITERPKNLTKHFLMYSDECPNWSKDDILEIEFLKRTGTVLKVRNINR